MSSIHIKREHHFSFKKARQIAFAWAEQAEDEFGMECTYEEGDAEDLVSFTRSGVNGTLRVCDQRFELDAQLGFLLGAFKGSIETEIVKRLDELLAGAAAKPGGKVKAPKKGAA
ncbi:polyhydroxyalkanoic acid system family protein [Hydrogenophaga soli]